MLIYYTEQEGGLWKPLEVSETQAEVLAHLQMQWRPMDKYTLIGGLRTHSVLFPDSSIWDSFWGDVREMGNNYYEVIRERIGDGTKTE